MDISNHVSFTRQDRPEILEYLQSNKITFGDTNGIIVFDILSSDLHWETIEHFSNEQKLLILSSPVFSEEERRQAQWLKIRSCWRRGYPQPEGNFKYETVTYTRENYCRECGCGLTQIAPFRMKKQPRWGPRHFLMMNWVDDELFLDGDAKKTLEDASVSGISFCEVHNKGGSETLPDTYQLVVNTCLKDGLVPEQSPLRATLVCEACGRRRYHPHGVGMYTFRKEFFEDAPDVVKSAEMFGWGHSSSRYILIRQSVYRLLVANRLDRGLEFFPIELI